MPVAEEYQQMLAVLKRFYLNRRYPGLGDDIVENCLLGQSSTNVGNVCLEMTWITHEHYL